MSLEKNIERIADALEAIAKAAGGKAVNIHEGQQVPAGQQMQPHMHQGSGQAPVQQAGGIPVSLPADRGMQWQGAGGQPGTFPPAQQGAPVQQPGFPSQPGPAPVQQPGFPPQQGPAPTQPPVAPPLQGATGQVPTTASAKQYTFDQLAVATANLASSGKDVFPILGRFGVSMLMDLPPEKFGEYAAALREAGAVI